MSANNPQQAPSDAGKTCQCSCKGSLIIWILLIIVVCTTLWVSFTERGQQTLGEIENKGPIIWLFGEGSTQVEDAAAAELEKIGVIVIKESGKGVTSISFDNCPNPSDETLKQISKLFRLSSANITNVEINDNQLAYFSNMRNLNNLLLNGTTIGDAGLAVLVDLPSLQNFQASHSKITDNGLEQIAKFSSLKILDLSYTNVSDRGMKQIAKLKGIEWLLLKGTSLTDAGLDDLAAIPELKHLSLTSDMKVSPEAIEKIKRALPKIQVDLDRPEAIDEKPAAAQPAAEDEKPNDAATTETEKKPDDL